MPRLYIANLKNNIMENPFNTEQNTAPKRSTLLTVFLVLTFIGSGLSFLSNAYFSMFFAHALDMVEYLAEDEAFGAILQPLAASVVQTGVWGYAFTTILYLASLVGAFMMWRLNKQGFHFYACAQIILLFVPMIFGFANFPSVFATLLTALFIFVYARELKIFAKPAEENVQE